MSQPPNSTMRPPRRRWALLSGVRFSSSAGAFNRVLLLSGKESKNSSSFRQTRNLACWFVKRQVVGRFGGQELLRRDIMRAITYMAYLRRAILPRQERGQMYLQPGGLSEGSRRLKRSEDLRRWANWFAPCRRARSGSGTVASRTPFQGADDHFDRVPVVYDRRLLSCSPPGSHSLSLLKEWWIPSQNYFHKHLAPGRAQSSCFLMLSDPPRFIAKRARYAAVKKQKTLLDAPTDWTTITCHNGEG